MLLGYTGTAGFVAIVALIPIVPGPDTTYMVGVGLVGSRSAAQSPNSVRWQVGK